MESVVLWTLSCSVFSITADVLKAQTRSMAIEAWQSSLQFQFKNFLLCKNHYFILVFSCLSNNILNILLNVCYMK